ncbi:MAG: hypothetical protein K8F31_00420 [Roseovarius sp.]|nr:hypothetical protein [Roseovarius sp.]
MQVRGRDIATECYRVSHEVDGREITALVPERLVQPQAHAKDRPSHQAAYEWMALNKRKIEAAIDRIARGGPARPPFDQITLIEER